MPNWIVVYSTINGNNANIVKAALEENGIKVVVKNKMDAMHTHLLNGEIEVFVNAKDTIQAKHIISDNKL